MDERAVEALMSRNWTLNTVEKVAFGLSLPLREALQRCASAPPKGWVADAYYLIGN